MLPNAPIDSATGLPIPTIAVATDGGVSVIKDDGTVVQKEVTDSVTDVAKVEFTNDGFLLVNRNNYHYFVITQINGAESTAHPSGFTGNINYFRNDGRRLFEVLDDHLATQEWLAQDYSIADIANWCWVRTHKWSGISIEGLDHLERWMKVMYDQPGMSAGLSVPMKVESLLDDDEKAKEFAKNAEKMVKK